MEMSYGSEGMEHYLTVPLQTGALRCDSDDYRLHMLTENEIPALIRPTIVAIDGSLTLRYPTGGRHVLSRVLMQIKPDGSIFRLLLSQIGACVKALEAFMLSPDDLVIAPEYMLYSHEKKELKMVYVPGYRQGIFGQLRDFFEYIMKRFDYRDVEGMRYLYSSYEQLSDDPVSVFPSDETEEQGAVYETDGYRPASCEAGADFGSVERESYECAGQVLSPTPVSVPSRGIRSTATASASKNRLSIVDAPSPASASAPSRRKKVLHGVTPRDIAFFATVAAMGVCVVLFFIFGCDVRLIVFLIALLAALLVQTVFAVGRDEEDPEEATMAMEAYRMHSFPAWSGANRPAADGPSTEGIAAERLAANQTGYNPVKDRYEEMLAFSEQVVKEKFPAAEKKVPKQKRTVPEETRAGAEKPVRAYATSSPSFTEGEQTTTLTWNESTEDTEAEEAIPVAGELRLVPLLSGTADALVLSSENPKIVVGRSKKGTDYRLATSQVSRIHAVLSWESGHGYVTDENSTNGTFVNGSRVAKKSTLEFQPGDTVSFAGEEFFATSQGL